MKKLATSAILCLLFATSLLAQAQNQFDIGQDRFLSGPTPVHAVDGTDDLFMSGDGIRSETAITGSAHMAGRNVTLDGAVGGDVYAAGMDIAINASVSGDVTVAGYDVSIRDVGGDLRASGKKLTLSGIVGGYTIINAERVSFNSYVKGDVSLTARQVEFSEDAQIEGNLILFEEQIGATEIPENVIPEDRIERHPTPGSQKANENLDVWDRRHPMMKFITRLLFVGIIAGLIAGLTPNTSAKIRQGIFHRPLLTLWLGFLALSAAIGAAIVLMITGIAFILVPIPLLIAFVSVLAGYFLGVYLVGIGVLSLIGREEQDRFSRRALTAATGAIAATLISRIPVLGWVGTLTIVLLGIGALAIWLFGSKTSTGTAS